MSAKIEIVAKKPQSFELQKFLEWVLSQEDGQFHPVNDETGESQGHNQGKEKIWFLAGSVGKSGPYNRLNCPVPANQEILIPLATSDYSQAEYAVSPGGEPEDENHLKEIAYAIARKHTNLLLEIKTDNQVYTFQVPDAGEGKSGDLELVETPVFSLIFPAKNVYAKYNVKGGPTRIAAVGWAIKVKLQPGTYDLRMKAEHAADSVTVRGKTIPISEFKLDITYKLLARPGFKTLQFAP